MANVMTALVLAATLTLVPIETSETVTTLTYHTQVDLTVDQPGYVKALGLTFTGDAGVPQVSNSYVGSVPKNQWIPTACGFGETGRKAYITGNGLYVSSSTTLGSFDFTFQKASLPADLGLVGEGITLDCSSWVNIDWQVVYPEVFTELVTMAGDCDWDGDIDFDDISPFLSCLGLSGLEVGDPADMDEDGDCDFDDVNLFIEAI
jgi:hypothetical protein